MRTASRPGPRVANTVVIGGIEHALADVVGYEIETELERDCAGQILCSTIYGVATCALLLAILVAGLDWKFLVGAAFVGAIALMCLADARAVKPVTIHRLRMQMVDGQQVVFAAGARQPVAALAARIDLLADRAA
jgi:hypothetical protein